MYWRTRVSAIGAAVVTILATGVGVAILLTSTPAFAYVNGHPSARTATNPNPRPSTRPAGMSRKKIGCTPVAPAPSGRNAAPHWLQVAGNGRVEPFSAVAT